MDSTRASRQSPWQFFKEDRMVRLSSRTFMFFKDAKASVMCLTDTGAQEPFSKKATVRFWRLWAEIWCSRVSMLQKIPLL